jgi:hypothetical protein
MISLLISDRRLLAFLLEIKCEVTIHDPKLTHCDVETEAVHK